MFALLVQIINCQWIATNMPLNQKWNSIAYGDDRFVAIGSGNVAAYSFDGKIWNVSNLLSNQNFISIIHRPSSPGVTGLFVAISTSGIVTYSNDGITWGQTAFPSNTECSSITYSYGFVAVAKNGNSLFSSSNGAIWTQTTLPSYQEWNYITSGYQYYYGNIYLVLSKSNVSAYSKDNINWYLTYMPFNQSWTSVVYGYYNNKENGAYLAISPNSSVAAYSANGANWYRISFPPGDWTSMIYGNQYMIISNGNISMTSGNGVNWSVYYLPLNQGWNSITCSSSVCVAVGNSNIGAVWGSG